MATRYLSDDEVFGSSTRYLSDDEVFGRSSPQKRPERTWGQAVSDTGVQLAEGVNTLLGAIPSLVAPNSGAADFFRSGAEYWRDKQSDPIKQRMAVADRAISAAGEEGLISQISEAAGQYFSDPALAARFVTTNLPSMIPGIGAAKLTQAAALAKGASAAQAATLATTVAGATNAALNAGGARGEAFEDIKQTLQAQGLSADEAEEQALRDSRVSAAVGALAGFVSGKTGLEGAIVGRAGAAGVGRAFAGGLIKEAAGEQLEEVTPKLTTNLLASQYDDRALTKDVGRTMVETAIGAAPGSVFAGGMDAYSARSAARPNLAPPPPAPPGALDLLDSATTDLTSAATDYLKPSDIVASTTVDEAIAKAAELAAAPAPAPTLDERIAQASAPGLLARQLDIQRQVDELTGLDLPASAARGTIEARPELTTSSFDTSASTPGLMPGQQRTLTQPTVFPEPSASTPGLEPGQQRTLTEPTVFAEPSASTPGLEPGQARVLSGPPRAQTPTEGMLDIAPIRAALQDRTLVSQMAPQERQQLLRAASDLSNSALPAATRTQAGQQAYEIIGRYQAAAQDTSALGVASRYGAAVTDGVPPTNVMPAARPPATAQPPLTYEPTAIEPTTSLGAAPESRVEGIEPTGLVRSLDEPGPTGGRRPLAQTEIPLAPGRPGMADTMVASGAGQVGATEQQNATLLGEPRDLGTELAKQRAEAGYQAPPTAPRPQKVNGTPTAQLTSEQLTQIASNASLPAITRRGAQIELGYRASEAKPATEATAAATAPAAQGAATVATEATTPAQTRPLDQPRPGVIVTSNAQMSTARTVTGAAADKIVEGDVEHTFTRVEPGKLGAPGRMINQVARIFGKKLVVFESDTLKSDGFVLDNDNQTIYLNAKSTVSPLAVFGHETLHLLKRDNATAYKALESVVRRNIDAEGQKAFKADYGADATIEELAADLTGNRFQEPQFWADVFGEIAAQNPTGARAVIVKLAAALNKAVNAFKAAVRGQGFRADQYVKDLDAVKAAVKTAVVQYAQQQREPAMRLEAELMRAESQAKLIAGSSSPAADSQAAAADTTTAEQTPAAPAAAPAAATVDEELAEVEAQTARFSRARRSDLPEAPATWKAAAQDKRQAQSYEKNNGIDPYLSEGQLQPEVATAKFSVKRAYGEKDLVKGKTNHPVLGVPLNANGTVTLYLPATNEEARRVAKDKRLRGASAQANRIYLTNESSGPKVMSNPGNIDQAMDGANVLVQVDPELLHLDTEYEDGRKDFFIQLAEGEAFARKMAQTKLFTLDAPRDRPLSKSTSISDIAEGISRGVTNYKSLALKERRAALKRAREVLKAEHNVGTLLGENGKLEKTRIGDYGLDYDGKSVVSLGLGLASAQKINEKLSTCPQAARCEGLCLGETSGQNLLYGGDGQFRSGPRLSQYLKTEALVQHPEEFAIVLYSEIERFSRNSAKEDFQPAIRLNVTSDFPPKVFQQIIEAFPGTMFYDYTKLDSKAIAPNHHLTYSSTGVAQEVNGQIIGVANRDKGNPGANWLQMAKKLDQGFNVAMAFTSRTSMPEFLKDEVTGKLYRVWNGDNYDARFLDPKQPDGVGMIVGLTNKDRTGKPEDAALKYDGFFVDYNPERDGSVLTVKDQKALTDKARGAERKVIPLMQESPARERAASDIPVTDLRGRKVRMPVRVEATGETATLTMDAGESLTDINEREDVMRRLLECLA